MSRILKVSQGDYRLQVQTGGNIILDTGNAAGTVTITGNLDVLGTQTVVESVNSYITDNIIQLNYNPNNPYGGDGISSALGYQAGIEIGRGSRDWAEFVFSEQVTHYDTLLNSNIVGTFQVKTRNTVGAQREREQVSVYKRNSYTESKTAFKGEQQSTGVGHLHTHT